MFVETRDQGTKLRVVHFLAEEATCIIVLHNCRDLFGICGNSFVKVADRLRRAFLVLPAFCFIASYFAKVSDGVSASTLASSVADAIANTESR